MTLFLGYAVAQDAYFVSQSPVSAPHREMRAVWLTTIGGRDWPHSYAMSAASVRRQQQEFRDILDRLAAAGINTVLLQSRIRATTLFPSDMEPWDGCTSGQPGQSPGYDPLAFAVEECHKRGMSLHAWVVAIPVGRWNGVGCRNLRRNFPKLLKRIGDEGFMSPEATGTADYLARFCADITRRYDVDGIHLDYIRYPDSWKKIRDRDKARDNITRIVRAVHVSVKREKPWVMVSCSPVGKYADTKRCSSRGWNARDAVCQDAASWLAEGLMDALFPMMYFRDDNFYPFAIDWLERSGGKIVTPGLGIYFLDPKEKDWPLDVITREMHVLRLYGMGVCMFRSKFLTDNVKGLYDYTKASFSLSLSLQPAMTWYDVPRPSAPDSLSVVALGDTALVLSWPSAAPSAVGRDGGVMYNVYGSATAPVDVRSADNLLMAAYRGNGIEIPQSNAVRHFAVTAVDRYGNESEARQSSDGSGGAADYAPSCSMAMRMLECADGNVFLDGCDVSVGQLVEVHSIVGNALLPRLVKKAGGRNAVDIASLPPGHYSLWLVNQKGYRHLIGKFSREIP